MLSILGPLEIISPVIVTSVLSFGLCIVALRYKMLADAFPTLAWLCFMQVPFILTSGGVFPDIAKIQMLGITLFTLALFVGDLCGLYARKSKPNAPINTLDGRPYQTIVVSLGILVLVIPIYHLSNVKTIPALMWLSDIYAPQAVSESREDFDKLLAVPTIMKYAFNWLMSVFGPVLIVALLFSRRFLWAGGFTVWLVMYALLSTAKGPIVIFVLLTMVGTSPLWGPRLAVIVRYSVFGVFILMIGAGIIRSVEITQKFNEGLRFEESFLELKNGLLAEFPERGFGLSDIDRLRESSADQRLQNTYKYLVYRVLLTPVEVSYHWYTYFPQYSEGWRAIGEIAGRRSEDQAHAANRVGIWAYRQFFPTKYAATVSAYASADADAYSFGGLFAVGLSALLVFFCRVSIIPVMHENQFGQALGLMMLVFLGLFPASASLQAIFVAQGFGVLLFFSCILILKSKLTKRP